MARQVEVFTAGCPLCDEAVQSVNELACECCEVTIYNLSEQKEQTGLEKAKQYSITSVPTVVVNGKVVECCGRPSVSKDALKAAGIGQPL